MVTKKKMVEDLRDAGLRKKPARELAKAADQAHSGDRAARSFVDKQSTALRDSISATVSHAKPPKKASAKKATASKPTAKKSLRKAPTKAAATQKAGSSRPTAEKARTGRT